MHRVVDPGSAGGLYPCASSRLFSRLASPHAFCSLLFLLLSSPTLGQGSELKAEEIGNATESLVSTLDVVILVGVLGKIPPDDERQEACSLSIILLS